MNIQPRKAWRRFLIVRARMFGSVKQEPADDRIQQREKRKQCSQTANNVMKNREEIKLFTIAIHTLNEAFSS
jgi:hypothetical protein